MHEQLIDVVLKRTLIQAKHYRLLKEVYFMHTCTHVLYLIVYIILFLLLQLKEQSAQPKDNVPPLSALPPSSSSVSPPRSMSKEKVCITCTY